jgi:hypothetical protein
MDDAIKNWMQDWVNRVNASNSENVFKKAFTENSNEIRIDLESLKGYDITFDLPFGVKIDDLK